MNEPTGFPLRLIDAFELEPETRAALRPDELVPDAEGRLRRLPRFFYEVPSWPAATDLQLVPHFTMAELMRVDMREAPAVRDFPRYVPCAVTVLASQLELFRQVVGAPLFIAANGGYRSPGHRLTQHASPHCWGTAANIYRIGDEYVDTRERIERYGALVAKHLPGGWARPFGTGVGFADDHLHLDLGYVTVIPRGAAGESGDGQRAATS